MTSVFRKGAPKLQKSGKLTKIISTGLHEMYQLRRKRIYGGSSGFCYRQTSWPLVCPTSTVSTFPASARLYADIGTVIHEQFQKAFEKEKILIAAEWYLGDVYGINIGGYVDAIVMLDGKPRVIEIKTCGKLPDKVKPDHRAQSLIYSLLTGIYNPIVLYQSRNVANWQGVLNTRELEVIATREELLLTGVNLVAADLCTKKGLLPPKPIHLTVKSHCGFCTLKDNCFEGMKFHPDVKHAEGVVWEEIRDEAFKKANWMIDNMEARWKELFVEIETKKEEEE